MTDESAPPLQEKPGTHVHVISLKRAVKRTLFPMTTHRRFNEQQQRNEWLQQKSYRERPGATTPAHPIKLSREGAAEQPPTPPLPTPTTPFLSEKGSPGNFYVSHTAQAAKLPALPGPSWPPFPDFPPPALRPRQPCGHGGFLPSTAAHAQPGLLQGAGRGVPGKFT